MNLLSKSKVPASKSVAGKKKKGAFVQRHHGVLALIIVLGWVVPPLAVLVRFGIGIDFFINVILTALGYFPGHAHNFFIQNVRNNYGRGRTPKWALKAGLVQDDTEYVKSTRQWGGRYDERNIRNAYDDPNRPFEDEHGNEIPHNAVERFVENHGIHPAQPGAGFGERGNDTIPQDDLLEGLPDEDRDRRRREKKNRKKEYGSGLEAYDQDVQDREAGTGIYDPSYGRNDSLIGDLEDPDRMRSSTSSASRRAGNASGGFGRDARDRAPSLNSYDSSEGATRRGLFSGKKSGRSKKSERYGLAADHKDLSSASSAYYGSSNSSGRERDRERQRDRDDSYNTSSSGNNNPYGTLSTRREYTGNNDNFGRSGSKYASNNPYGGNDRYASSNNSSNRGRYDEADDDYDRYEIRTSGDKRNKSRRNDDDNEDFLNHQF